MDRSQLQTLLEGLVGSGKVYFQPPESVQMEYPCIVYARDGSDSRFADNDPYKIVKRYQVTVIDRDPDSEIPDKVEELRLCTRSAFFTSENLNHDVFILYF